VRTPLARKLLLVGFGLALVCALEVALRVFGLGGYPPLLVPLFPDSEDPAEAAIYELNPLITEPFFARLGPDGWDTFGGHLRERVTLPKPDGTVRVLFLGASSVEGFPLPRNLTTARFLERMLSHALPKQRVEVLNLGVTALASFPVRVIGEQAIRRLDPDLVLVYSGHNEFFGASGVASRQYLGSSVAAMQAVYWLRGTAFRQLLHDLMRLRAPGREEQRLRLIETMPRVSAIDPDGALHEAAEKSLFTNLEALVAAARSASVPIVLSTLVSLERGLVPIAAWDDRSETERRHWHERLSSLASFAGTPTHATLGALDQLRAEAPRHATAIYSQASVLHALGRRDEAVELYRLARDLDAMPWRAPRSLSRKVLELASEAGVPLADAGARFGSRAGGATDWELFNDHVHPTLEGQALLAETFFETIAGASLLPLTDEGIAAVPPWEEIAISLGAHHLERYLVIHKMVALFVTPPFDTHNLAVAARLQRHWKQIEETVDPVDRAAIALWRQMTADAGFMVPISYPAGRAALAAGDFERARRYLKSAVANAPEWSDERCLAEAARLEAVLASGRRADFSAQLSQALKEAEAVSRMQGQPTAVLAASMARLLTLAGRDDAADIEWERAHELSLDAPAWARAYLSRLSSRQELRSAIRHD
jgi:tetratricopeptide (TPR) repeat protein